MAISIEQGEDWSALSPHEKNSRLFLRQKGLLDTFLERGAITKAQYNKSLGDLIVKMGIDGDHLPSDSAPRGKS